MRGWGIIGRFGWPRRGKRRTAELLVDALNARRYEKLDALVIDDLLYLDTMSNPLRGRAAFVSTNLRLHLEAPDLTIELDDFSQSAGTLLVRGRTVSSVPDYCSESLWQVKFAGDKISEIQAYRDNNAISLPLLAERGDAGEHG